MSPQVLFQRLMEEVDWNPVLRTAVRATTIKSEPRARELLVAFLQWFALIPFTDRPIQMLGSVDRIWHSFILNTALYTSVCERFIGRYIHHDPMDPERHLADKEEYARHTLALLEEAYGTSLASPLTALSGPVTCCVGCGSDPGRHIER